MASPSIDNNKSPIERAFEGAARDASLLLATVAIASTNAPTVGDGGGGGGVPREVVRVGRKGESAEVESKAERSSSTGFKSTAATAAPP